MHSIYLVTFFIFFVYQWALIETSFTADFNRFLKKIYGKTTQQALERRDWNDMGSFGGKTYAGEKTSKQAHRIRSWTVNERARFSRYSPIFPQQWIQGRRIVCDDMG